MTRLQINRARRSPFGVKSTLLIGLTLSLLLSCGRTDAVIKSSQSLIQTSCAPAHLAKPIFWDIDSLAKAKSRIDAGDATLTPAYNSLIERASSALELAPFSVTHKPQPGPSGDKQDYVSLSRYFWPDPNMKDGLPYIRKDGHSNPEINSKNFDRRRSQDMANAIRDLSLAAYFTGDHRYSEQAGKLVYTWFVDKNLRMNPNLKFAQGVPGKTAGREFGILDTRIYWDVMDGLLLLQSANMADAKQVDAVRHWFKEYSNWLMTSDFGKKAKGKYNNHGTFYDAQLAQSLIFAGQCDLAKKALKSGLDRTQKQITSSGLMPGEIDRTRSLFYHAFNAQAFLRMSHLSETLGIEFYTVRKDDAGSVKDSVYFIASYAGRTHAWPYEEISSNVEKSIWTMLKYAQFVDDNAGIEEALERLGYRDSQSYLNLLGG